MLLCLLSLAGNASAVDVHWDGDAGAGSPNWNVATNWSTDAVPTAIVDDVKAIVVPGYGPTIANAGAVANTVDVGTWGWEGELTIQAAGDLTTTVHLTIAFDANMVGTVDNSGTINTGASLIVGENGNGFITNSGTANIGTTVLIGDLAGSEGTVDNTSTGNIASNSTMYVGQLGKGSLTNSGAITASDILISNGIGSMGTMENSGTVDVTGWIYLGSVPAQNGDGQLTMTDGSITTPVAGNLQLGEATGGLGHINLDGGTIDIGNLGINGTDLEGTMDVTGGTMIIDGDETGGVNYLASLNVFTAHGGWGTLNVDYNTSNPGKTTVTATAPGAVAATDVYWQGDTGASNYWDRAKNWNADGSHKVPRAVDDAHLTWIAATEPPIIRIGSVVDANQVVIHDDTLAGIATLTVAGGSLTCNAALEMGTAGPAHLQLDAGTVTAVDLAGDPANATIDIEEGVLILDGDETATIEALISLGTLTAYNGSGYIAYDYDVTNSGKTTVRTCITTPIGDLNSDCVVNFKDFAMIANNWLVDSSLP